MEADATPQTTTAALEQAIAKNPQDYIDYSEFPRYPRDARRQRRHGSGIFILHIDRASGRVTAVSVGQSTGHTDLDNVSVAALNKWRFRSLGGRGELLARVPITFEVPSRHDRQVLPYMRRLPMREKRNK